MKNVLIVSGHTDLNDSVANDLVLRKLKTQFLQAEYTVLSELYPDFNIDVEAEQQKLRRADIVVWQFPVFWYSMPSIMHRWVEDVFVHGFSHGSTGTALKGKKLVASFTTGGPAETYLPNGFNGDIDGVLRPIQRGILQFVGFDVLHPHICYAPVRVSQEEREAWLAQWAERLGQIEQESPIVVGRYQ